MSKNQKNSLSKVVNAVNPTLPPRPHLQTEWNLAALYYKNERDPRLEADVAAAEQAYTNFAKRWRSKPFATKVTTLGQALAEYEALAALPEVTRPGRYFSFRLALNVNDSVAEKRLSLLSQRFRKASEQTIFFTLTLGSIPKSQQKIFLKASALASFRYYLEQLFRAASHHLTEPEEKIIMLKQRQSSGMWTDMTEKIISTRHIIWKGKSVALPEALELIDRQPSRNKPKLWSQIISEMEKIGEVAEHEFNAIITDVRTEDERRHFQKPYSATALAYEDTESSIEALVEAVSGKGFALSRKFYAAKAKFHGVETLDYSQKYDSIGPELTISFSEAVDICREVFYGLKNEYGAIFDRMLERGQIDVYPRPGKRGGAFMSSAVGHPTHVFLNHVNNFKSLETLAHEMGHAIHSERSKQQSPFYEGHSITTAETASTLFENLVFDALYQRASANDQFTLLHDRITRDISTIERQIAFFNCELEIHETIHRSGAMTNEELRACMERHLKSYLGKSVNVSPRDGYSYVYIPHLRYNFYVYTYAFGLLMSTTMANRYAADRSYIKQIDAFLSAGASASVADIFKQIGINTTKTDTYTQALKNHEHDINRFAKLLPKQNS